MNPIHPGGTIGVIGGGQLARMTALEAGRMGYRVVVLDPTPGCPAALVGAHQVQAELNDLDAARELARQSDVVTVDTEHVPAELLDELESLTHVRPGGHVLRQIQDRLAQRRFLEAEGMPQANHASIESDDDLEFAAALVGFPAVLKTRREGYDGKGQSRVESIDSLRSAWATHSPTPCILEAFIDFEREVSVVLARGVDGAIRAHPVVENVHRRHILHTSQAPASIPDSLAKQAEEIGAKIAAALGHIGTIAVELFVTREGELLVNEIAPRTHNSGHFTFGGCATSQFEQHVRAICGLPLGDPTLLRPAVILNLLGDVWKGGAPRWDVLLGEASVRLHVYGKHRASIGRKMGHLLILDDEVERALALAHEIDRQLEKGLEPARTSEE